MSGFEKARKELNISRVAAERKIMFINRKMNAYLKKKGVFRPYNQKFLEKVELFRRLIGINPCKLSQHQAYRWLLSIWEDGSNEIIKKTGSSNFYLSDAWIDLRWRVIEAYGYNCMKCGSKHNIHVDHIKPRSIYPNLELDFNNMQILCKGCNFKKSNKNCVDYRPGKKSKLFPDMETNNLTKEF